MSDENAIEVEFYTQQLDDAKNKLLVDKENSELKDLVIHLETTIENLVRTKNSKESVTQQAEEVTVVGRTCEAFFDGKWFNAEVLALRTDDKGITRAIVKLMGTDQAREYDIKDIKLLPLAAMEAFPVGKRVQAIWLDDGLWYNATVSNFSATGDEVIVSFDGFEGDASTVKLDQIREPVVAPRQEKVKEVKTYTTPGGYVIPENLRVDKKKDSEEVILDKKRKAHHLKSQQRSERHTAEAAAGKQKWQQFQQKIVRR